MKQQDLKLGVEYAVIPAWDYSSAEKKDSTKTRRSDVVKATLVNLNKYEYKVYRSEDENDSEFKPVPANSRVVGFMVESNLDNATTSTKWISRPQDIVSEYATLENRWATEEREAQERELKIRQEREEQERKQREAYEYQNRISGNLIEALRSVIGAKVENIRTDINNRRNENGDYLPVATMTIDMKTMELLVEKVLEAKDLLS